MLLYTFSLTTPLTSLKRENCWSKVKEFIRSIAPRTYDDLAQAIDTAFQRVSRKDIHHWFTHCCYCLTEYLEPDSSFSPHSSI